MARQKPLKKAKKQSKNRKKRPFFEYPLFIFLLICAGVFLAAWTWRAGAANILVSAKVSAPFVTQPATITTPLEGQHFTSIPITLEGTCPTNAAYVEIFDNGVMRGSTICDGGMAYSLTADLFPGANSLVAKVFNSTDDEGPVSAPVAVYYDVPQPPGGTTPPPSSNSGGQPEAPVPLILKTNFVYKGFHVGDPVIWPIELGGGVGPYAVSVDWGDGTSDLLSRSQTGQFDINHVYSSAGSYKDSYVIKIKATDAAGQGAFLQFFVVITPASGVQQSGGIFSKPTPTIGQGLSWLWLAWPLYSVILLMVLSYKLGEREELIILRRKGGLRR